MGIGRSSIARRERGAETRPPTHLCPNDFSLSLAPLEAAHDSPTTRLRLLDELSPRGLERLVLLGLGVLREKRAEEVFGEGAGVGQRDDGVIVGMEDEYWRANRLCRGEVQDEPSVRRKAIQRQTTTPCHAPQSRSSCRNGYVGGGGALREGEGSAGVATGLGCSCRACMFPAKTRPTRRARRG